MERLVHSSETSATQVDSFRIYALPAGSLSVAALSRSEDMVVSLEPARDTLDLLSQNYHPAAISQELDIPPTSITRHLEEARTFFDARTDDQAAHRAIEYGTIHIQRRTGRPRRTLGKKALHAANALIAGYHPDDADTETGDFHWDVATGIEKLLATTRAGNNTPCALRRLFESSFFEPPSPLRKPLVLFRVAGGENLQELTAQQQETINIKSQGMPTVRDYTVQDDLKAARPRMRVGSNHGTIGRAIILGYDLGLEYESGDHTKFWTNRRTQVLYGITQGLTDKQIAAALFWTENSVMTTVKLILTELEALNRWHVVRRAFEAGVFGVLPPISSDGKDVVGAQL